MTTPDSRTNMFRDSFDVFYPIKEHELAVALSARPSTIRLVNRRSVDGSELSFLHFLSSFVVACHLNWPTISVLRDLESLDNLRALHLSTAKNCNLDLAVFQNLEYLILEWHTKYNNLQLLSRLREGTLVRATSSAARSLLSLPRLQSRVLFLQLMTYHARRFRIIKHYSILICVAGALRSILSR